MVQYPTPYLDRLGKEPFIANVFLNFIPSLNTLLKSFYLSFSQIIFTFLNPDLISSRIWKKLLLPSAKKVLGTSSMITDRACGRTSLIFLRTIITSADCVDFLTEVFVSGMDECIQLKQINQDMTECFCVSQLR